MAEGIDRKFDGTLTPFRHLLEHLTAAREDGIFDIQGGDGRANF